VRAIAAPADPQHLSAIVHDGAGEAYIRISGSSEKQ
jgi:hypothetical protein